MRLFFCNIIFLLVILPAVSAAGPGSKNNQSGVSHGVEGLSPELRKLLQKEMQALQNGMMEIIPAYISGDWSKIDNIALKMKNSFILRQALTDKQKHELHSVLPETFIKLDQQFHYLSGMLSHVAKNKKQELVGFYFSKLGESCVGCHEQFATHKFPALSKKPSEEKHEH